MISWTPRIIFWIQFLLKCPNYLDRESTKTNVLRLSWDQPCCRWWLFHSKLSRSLKLYLKFSYFKIQIFQTTSDVKTNRNVIYNFIVDGFFIRNHLSSQKFIWSCHIVKFKNFKQSQIKKTTRRKSIDLNKLYNIPIETFFHLSLFRTSNNYYNI